MKSGREYLPADGMYPLQGIDSTSPSPLKDPKLSPSSENMVFSKGVLSKRKGYVTLGDDITNPIIGLIDFETGTGTRILVALTTTKQYRYDATADEWVNITYDDGGDVDWTGDEDDELDWCIGSDENNRWLIVTNGKDMPRQWNGSTARMELLDINYPNFTTCKTLAIFFSHLVLGNVTISGAQQPQNLLWSDTADFTEWTTGNAGFLQLSGMIGEVIQILPMAQRLNIYTSNSIGVLTYVGGTALFTFGVLVQGIRMLSGRSIVEVGPLHLFPSSENFYVFDGSRVLKPFGDRVSAQLQEGLSLANDNRVVGFHDNLKQQVMWIIPSSSSEAKVFLFEYDQFHVSTFKWSVFDYGERPTCFGFYTQHEVLAWNSASMSGRPWSGETENWKTFASEIGFPERVMGSEGQAYLLGEVEEDDAEENIDSWWDTIDFTVPKAYQSMLGRWIEMEFEAQGNAIDIYYSVDKGEGYTFVEHVTLSENWHREKVFFDVVGETLRIRVRHSDVEGCFSLRWVRVWLRPGGPR